MYQSVTLLGNLGSDPEVRFLDSGAQVTNFSIATNESWKDKNTGEKQNRATWHRCVCWNRTAEIAAEYLKKGNLCLVRGRIQNRKYTDQQGIEKHISEIVVDELKLMPQSEGGNGNGNGHQSPPPAQQQAPKQQAQVAEQPPEPADQVQTSYHDEGDDLPF